MIKPSLSELAGACFGDGSRYTIGRQNVYTGAEGNGGGCIHPTVAYEIGPEFCTKQGLGVGTDPFELLTWTEFFRRRDVTDGRSFLDQRAWLLPLL